MSEFTKSPDEYEASFSENRVLCFVFSYLYDLLYGSYLDHLDKIRLKV